MASLVALAPAIEKRRLYRGRGGEIMRAAVCRLVECITTSSIPLSTQEQVQLLDCVDGCIAHPSNAIQVAACQALEQLMSRYFPVRESGPTSRLQARVVDKFVQQVQENDNPGATRGYALALGHLPAKLLAPRREVIDSVLDCLRKAARYDSLVGGESDAETRRNALQSLRRLTKTVGLRCQSQQAVYPTVQLEQDRVQRLFDSYQLALRDYKSDKRGDVGCWCRMEALDGIAVLVQLLSDDNPAHISISCETITRLVAEMLRQASEQLDTVRRKAGDCLDEILRSTYAASRVDGHEKLLQALRLDSTLPREERPWGDPRFSFSIVLKASSVGVDEYFLHVVAGLALSVGGLTKSVSNAASAALLAWLDEVNDTDFPLKLAMVLLDLLRQSTCNIRVSLPTVRTLQTLFKNKFLRRLPSNQRGEVAERCVLAFLETERSADDVHRLHALVDATTSLLEDDALVQNQDSGTAARSCALAFLCHMLAHKYPRVRAYTAEHLYVLLLDDHASVGSRTSSIELILETPWASTTTNDGDDFSGPSQRLAVGLGVETAWDAMRNSKARVGVR
jgi:tubulin-specific chaperone D